MKIKLYPVSRDETLELLRSGSTLTVNGKSFDFSTMADGDTLPAAAIDSQWFVGSVEKIGSELELTIIIPLQANYSPEQAFPADLVGIPDGAVVLPHPLPDEIGNYPDLDRKSVV